MITATAAKARRRRLAEAEERIWKKERLFTAASMDGAFAKVGLSFQKWAVAGGGRHTATAMHGSSPCSQAIGWIGASQRKRSTRRPDRTGGYLLMTSDTTTFADLGVPQALVDVLERQGITSPFEVQTFTIPDALDGRDVLGRAPTGSGKTLAFGLPLLADLGEGKSRRPRGLILAPTRELAEQIRRELDPLASAMGRSVLSVYGGVGLGPQIKALRAGVDLLVACPGRLQDLISQGAMSLSQVDKVVIDEADRMADMGFLPVVQEILDLTSSKRQTVLFSATLDREVEVLTKRYQKNPARHEVGETEPDLSLVEHRFIATEKEHKLGLTADLIDDSGPTMVFCRTRHGVDRVAKQLKRVGVKAGWIHGGRSQSQRDMALSAFTDGRVSVLVATDVAARGIHVDGVACVVHYDPPADHKDYVHRSGRTARAGSGGLVVSLVNKDQRTAVARLQKKVGLPKADPEPTPTLRARTVEPWVDQRAEKAKAKGGKSRPGRGGSRNASGKPRSGSRDKPKNRSNGTSTERSEENAESRGGRGAGRSSGNGRGGGGGGGGSAGNSDSRRSDSPRSDSRRSDSRRSDSRRGKAQGRPSAEPRSASDHNDEKSQGSDGRQPGKGSGPSGSAGKAKGRPGGKKRSTQSKNSTKAKKGKATSPARSGRSRSKDHKLRRNR